MSTAITDTQVPRSAPSTTAGLKKIPSDCPTTYIHATTEIILAQEGKSCLEIREPKLEPTIVLAQGKLAPRLQLVQRGR